MMEPPPQKLKFPINLRGNRALLPFPPPPPPKKKKTNKKNSKIPKRLSRRGTKIVNKKLSDLN